MIRHLFSTDSIRGTAPDRRPNQRNCGTLRESWQ